MRLPGMLGSLLATLVDALVEPRCLVCESVLPPVAASGLCRACDGAWPGVPAPFRVAGVEPALAAWDYDGTARKLVVRAKEEPRSPSWPLLRARFLRLALCSGLEAGAVIAVPPSRERRRRGWHLAGELATALREASGWPAGPVLRRRHERPPQAGLDAAARRGNLRGCFETALRRAATAPPRVWVVDDVATTGATLQECARVLRAAGAERVGGLLLCRVP